MAAGKRRLRVRRDGKLRARRYGRVSTEEQNEDGAVSIPEQDRITAAYVGRKEEWADLGFIYDEESGTTTDRPEWQRVLAECRRGEVDVIVCAKMNRFARSSREGENQLHELEQMGVEVVLIDADFDTTTPTGKAFRSMMLVWAQLDRDNIIEQMARGQYGKARRGGWPSSRSAAPFGLRVEGTGRSAVLVIDEAEAATIRKAAALVVDERREPPEVCRTLQALGHLPRNGGYWRTENLRKMLAHPARMGVVVWGKPHPEIERYGEPVAIPKVPAVLTPERWQAVQDVLAMRRSRPPSARRAYPLSGRVTAPCGRQYTGYGQSDRPPRYKCQGNRWSPAPDWQNCGCPRLEAASIEGRVWQEVTSLLTSPSRLRELASQYLHLGADSDQRAAEVRSLDRQISTLRQRITQDTAGYIRAGADPAVLAGAMQVLNEELGLLIARRDAVSRYLLASQQAQQQLSSLDRLASTAGSRLAGMNLDQQAEVLALLDVRVTSHPDGSLHITGTVCELELPVEPGLTETKVPVLPGSIAAPFVVELAA